MHTFRQHDRMPLEGRSAGAQPAARTGEEGFMLLAVVVMVALVLIALSVAAPVVARQLRRDKEIESQHRMNEYVRAIQLYQRRLQGQYPASIKVLENTNNVRFLRHVYVDPLTGKADYKLIHLGEQKTKIHVFFGQELDGLAANLGSAAGMQAGGAGMAAPGIGGGSSTISSTSALSSGFQGATIGGSSGAGGVGASTTGTSDSSGTSGSGGTGSGTSTTGTSGTGSTSGTSSSSSSDSSIGSLGVIVGVGTSRSGTSITQPNAQTSYEAWEFWYDPRIEMLRQGVNVTGGGMTGGGGTPGGGIGSQSASSYGQNAVTGVSNSPTNSSTGTTGNTGTPGSSNPNSSVPNPF
jgi:type II secretory pathway pseudopilin PulG